MPRRARAPEPGTAQLGTDLPEPAPPVSAAELLAWYDRMGRDLPWRVKGGARPDPYRVWLSEIMLQQTTVAAVRDYYAAFLARWPDVAALAAADEEDVLRAWAGLGYYARARNLHACARVVMRECAGRFPDTEEGLRALPGIGPYTAGAIAAIAFGRPAVAVDGNVERVIARVFAIETPLPAAKAEIARRTRALLPPDRSGDFAQALMDLGATICTPRTPACALCPWSTGCAGRRTGRAGDLPVKPARRATPLRHGAAFVAIDGRGCVLLRRRPAKGLLGGMLETPTTDWAHAPPTDPLAHAPLRADWQRCPGGVEHVFTHFRLALAVYLATGVAADGTEGRWVARAALAGEALPNLMHKVLVHAFDHLDRAG